jgi:hypothetical protein
VDQVDELAQSAQDAADDRLGEAEESLEDAGRDFDDGLQEARDALDGEHASLAEEGFEALAGAVDESETAVAAAGGETGQAFDAFGSALEGLQREAEGAFDAAEAEAERGRTALAEQGSTVASEAAECAEAFEACATEFDGTAAALRSEADTLYDTAGGESRTKAQQLMEAVRTLMDETAEHAATAGAEEVEAPAAVVLTGAVEPHLEELAQVQASLEAGATTGEELQPLAEDLDRSQRVAGTIEELLKAMEG